MKQIEEYTTEELVALYKKLTMYATTWWMKKTRTYNMTEEEKDKPFYYWFTKQFGGSIYGLTEEQKAKLEAGEFLPSSFDGFVIGMRIDILENQKERLITLGRDENWDEIIKLEYELSAMSILKQTDRWIHRNEFVYEDDFELYEDAPDIDDNGLATDRFVYQFIWDTLQYQDTKHLGKLLKFADNGYRQKWEMIRSNAGRKDKVAEIQQIDIESGSVVATYMMRKDIIAKTGIKKSHLAQCIKTAKENPGNRNEWKKWKGSDGKLYGFAESQ